jgi:hypothetical protein
MNNIVDIKNITFPKLHHVLLDSLTRKNTAIKTIIFRVMEEISNIAIVVENATWQDDKFYSFITVLTGMILPAMLVINREERLVNKTACIAWLLLGSLVVYKAGLLGSGIGRILIGNTKTTGIVSDTAAAVARLLSSSLIGVPWIFTAFKLLRAQPGAQPLFPPLEINLQPFLPPLLELGLIFEQIRRPAINTLSRLSSTL